MKKHKFYFLDIHVSDFIFTPFSYFIIGKRPLLKYQYLSRIKFSGIINSTLSSSLPAKLRILFPSFPLRLFSVIEFFLWKKINRLKTPKVNINNLDSDDIIFMFAYKNIDQSLQYLVDINFNGKVIVHLSHIHTFIIDKIFFDLLNIELCFDNDISFHPYFIKKYPFYKKNILIVPFSLNNKFFNHIRIKSSQKHILTICGTFHKFPIGTFDIEFDGFSTLHPLRLALANYDKFSINVNNRLSLYHSNSILSVIIGQKKYFNFDIVKEYQDSSYALIPGEGNGAIAIGSIEAMACGCTVLLSSWEIKSLNLNTSIADYIEYQDFNHLISIISNLKSNFYISFKNIKFASRYRSEILLEDFNDIFK